MKSTAVVLIHIGSELPPHVIFCLEQLRKFYGGDITFLVEEKLRSNPIFDKYNVNTTSLESLAEHNSTLDEFRRVSFMHNWGAFWHVTYERLFYLQQYMEVVRYDSIIHIENDILVYTDIENLWNMLGSLYKDKVAINPVGDKHSAIAFTYIDNIATLKKVNKSIITFIAKGERALQRLTNESLVSEMIILDYMRKNGYLMLDILPLSPSSTNSCTRNLDKMNLLFDGASWGQYVGGTTDKIPGWTGSHHYVGRDIQSGLYTVEWTRDEKNRKVPLVVGSCEPTRLANLHIHSKQLELYLS